MNLDYLDGRKTKNEAFWVDLVSGTNLGIGSLLEEPLQGNVKVYWGESTRENYMADVPENGFIMLGDRKVEKDSYLTLTYQKKGNVGRTKTTLPLGPK